MAQRLPKAQPKLAAVVDALTRDQPVKARDVAKPEAPKPPQLKGTWDDRFANFLERVMATAAIGGDPAPLKKELDQLLNEAPPGKREELEKNRGKPPKS
jgi:hypothetical protein